MIRNFDVDEARGRLLHAQLLAEGRAEVARYEWLPAVETPPVSILDVVIPCIRQAV